MAEELIMNVKSNVKQVTTDTNEYKTSIEGVNDKINDTNRFLIKQEKELIKLKAQQDAIPKGAWVAGMDKLNDKISQTNTQIKLSKNSLKGLKEEQKGAAAAAKKLADAQKEQNATLKGGVGNFQIMGVSLNGIKRAFSLIIPTAKIMFATIKTGLISTGIGAFVVAIGTLIAYFTQTKVGAEMISRAFAGVGAAISVITDRISLIGGAIVKVFKRDYKGALEDVKNSAKGITEEIGKEYEEAKKLKGILQGVADAERGLNTQRAESNNLIAKARMDAEDTSLSQEERIKALQTASELELAVTAEALRIQLIKVEAVKEQARLSNSLSKDLDAVNAEEVKLIDMQTASYKTTKKLDREMNKLRRSGSSERSARRQKEKQKEEEQAQATIDLAKQTAKILEDIRFKGIEDAEELAQAKLQSAYDSSAAEIEASVATQLEKDAAIEALLTQHELNKEAITQEFKNVAKAKSDEEAEALLELKQENLLAETEDLRARALEELTIQEEKEMASVSKMDNAEAMQLAITKKFNRKRNDVNKEADDKDAANAEALKNLKIGMAMQGLSLIQDIAGKGTALAKAAAIAQATISGVQGVQAAFTSANANVGATAGSFGVYPVTMAAIAGGFAAMNIAKIASSQPPDTNITPPDPSAAMDASTSGPAPEMMSGAFELGGGLEPEPMKAFVVTDEMTNSQDQLANIRRTATI